MVMKLELTPRPVPKAPSEERWRQMSKDERELFIVSVNEALSDRLYRSNVLGIDLAIVDGGLKFYQGTAELYDTAHLIRRLEGMVTNLEKKNDEAVREAEKNRVTIRDTIVAVLAARGVTCTDERLEQLHSCIDADMLKRWVTRALTVTSEADVFSAKE